MTSLQQFKRDIRKTAKANGIKIKLLNKEEVLAPDENLPCPGYFSDEYKELCVAMKGKEAEWLSTLVHESCHMDQYLENQFLWKKCEPAYDIFSDWLLNKAEPPDDILRESIQDIIRLELDCEKRSIKKIKEYDLNLDIPTYIQSANINLYAYLFFYETKSWCNDIFERRSVSKLAPKGFRRKYDKIPVRFHRALQKEYTAKYLLQDS